MTETTAGLLGIGAACGAVLGIAGVAALVWKLALPWLREQIVKPVQQTNEQVTNSHDTNLRDDITGIRDTLDRHLTWSSEETSRLWSAISRKADR